ncbi:MAG: hypothetical protein AAF799_01270 [Myxococcota bacterium]
MSTRYFSAQVDSMDGDEDEGTFYCEVGDGQILRHISVFGGTMYWATPDAEFDEVYGFTDQPEFDRSEYDAEITRERFLELWAAALRQPRDPT